MEDNSYIRSSFCVISACLEVKSEKEMIKIRHSKNHKKVLTISKEEWKSFIRGVRVGEFDFSQKGGS